MNSRYYWSNKDLKVTIIDANKTSINYSSHIFCENHTIIIKFYLFHYYY